MSALLCFLPFYFLVLPYSVTSFMQRWLRFTMVCARPLSPRLQPPVLRPFYYYVSWCSLHWQLSGAGIHEGNDDAVRWLLPSTTCLNQAFAKRLPVSVSQLSECISLYLDLPQSGLLLFALVSWVHAVVPTYCNLNWKTGNGIMPFAQLKALQCLISSQACMQAWGNFPDKSLLKH